MDRSPLISRVVAAGMPPPAPGPLAGALWGSGR